MSATGQGRAYVGVDLGTSGLKVTVVDPDGVVLTEAEEAYDVRAPHPGHAETDPREWSAALEGQGGAS